MVTAMIGNVKQETTKTISLFKGWNLVYVILEDEIGIDSIENGCGNSIALSIQGKTLKTENALSGGVSYLLRVGKTAKLRFQAKEFSKVKST